MNDANSSRTQGVHHLGLTIPDLERTRDFFTEVLRFERVGEEPDVQIEFAPEPLGDGPTRHMMCAIPGGIRLELIAPAAG